MNRRVLTFVLAITASSILLTFCKKDNDEKDPAPNPEYIATDASFQNFMNWVLEAELNGPDPALGPAHHGNDSTVTRHVFFKDGVDPVNGLYPLGSIIVKQSNNHDFTINEVTAMVKRGNNFDPNHNDWEYFMLTPDGNIAEDGDGNPMRGADLMGGMCVACHTQASSSDYIFSKK